MYTRHKIKLAAMKPVFGILGKRMMPQTNLVKGAGSISKVASIIQEKSIDNVLIVTDKVLFELGLLTPMLNSFENENITYSLYTDVTPDPTFTIVEKAIDVCRKNKCEAVIGFGGGSVLDTAKTVAASAGNGYKHPLKFEGMMKVYKKPIPFIAIPTTAGTGSEVTIVAVVSDPITHKKTTIVDLKLIASDTILDPEITIGLPSHITSTTGLDALTHAIEAYVSGFANDYTDDYALQAIRLITDNLYEAYTNPSNIKARENLLEGSMLAGMAFTRTYVGYVHAFSHNIGGKYGVAHGLGNAVLLPHIMQDSKDNAKVRFAQLSDFLSLCDTSLSNDDKADIFIKYLFNLNEKLGIPKRLDKFPKSGIEDIINGAFKEAHGTYPVPRYYTKEEAREMLMKVCSL